MKPMGIEYKGYRFRTALEARWAIFFDACGVDWEYEPECYDLGDGLSYVPDFLLHGVSGRAGGDLYVEVIPRMTELDAIKIKRFAERSWDMEGMEEVIKNPVLIVGRLPDGVSAVDISEDICWRAYCSENKGWPYEFNFETIDCDHFAAHPGINKKGGFELFGDDNNYLRDRDDDATEKAYRAARQARFEFGRVPTVGRVCHA